MIAVAFAKEKNAPVHRNVNTVVDNCGGTITAAQTIKSPGFDEYGYYYNNMYCVWTINMPDSDFIELAPRVFSLENGGTSCEYDAVRINDADGETTDGPFCGTWNQDSRKRRQAAKDSKDERQAMRSGTLDYNIRIYDGDSIVFNSDGSVVYEGFEFDINAYTCSQSFTGSGVVTSPNHPLNYDNDVSCEYNLEAEAGKHLKLTFTHWDVENDSNCEYDSLTVNETKYCGRNMTEENAPAYEMIIPATNAVLNWSSDGSVVGTGFRFEFESVDPADDVEEPTANPNQDPAAFWANFSDFYTQTKAQMEAGDRPWKTPHFTWMYNRIMSHNIEEQSQLEGDCTWALETGNQHPSYEPVTVESFNPDVDRCINLMTMADMGLDYIDSYVCMTGNPKPRGTLRRYDKKINSFFTIHMVFYMILDLRFF